MRGKLMFITGGLAGYVLGARAGRGRYDQIAASARKLWNAKPVQRRVSEVRDYALETVGDIPAALFTAVKKLIKAGRAKKKRSKALAPMPSANAKVSGSKQSGKPAATSAGGAPSDASPKSADTAGEQTRDTDDTAGRNAAGGKAGAAAGGKPAKGRAGKTKSSTSGSGDETTK